MEEINMSSCSFSSDGEDNEAIEIHDKVDEEQVEANKSHITEVNKQLQATVNTLRQQLKSALEATESINTMNGTINQLRSQLSEAKDNEKNLSKELKRISSEKEESEGQLNEEINNLRKQLEDMQQLVNAEQEKTNRAKKEKKVLKQELDGKTNDIENIAIELKDAKNSKKKLRSKFMQAAEKIQELEAENQELNLKLQEEENQKSTLLQEVDSLKIKISTTESMKAESDGMITKLNETINRKEALIKTFEGQFEEQHHEMEEMNDERQKALLLVQQIHRALSAAEFKIEELQKVNTEANAKIEKLSKKVKAGPSVEISEITMPFEGDMGQKADYYMKLPQYQSTQRLQLVINEAAKRLSEAERQVDEKTNEIQQLQQQLEISVSGQTPYCQILDALLRELKNIACQEAQINNANLCRVDTQFIEFMAEKSAELEPIIREDLLKDPRFIPSEFFTSIDASKKLECLKELLNLSDMSYSIFTAEFLTNQLLINQLNALMGPLGKMEEISRLDVVGGDFNDIPNLLKSLQAKIASLKKTRTQLHTLLKQEKESSNTLAKSQNELRTQVSQLQITNESLQSEVDVLRVKYQVASNQLLLKNNEENLNKFTNQIRDDVAEKQEEAKATTIRLEQELEKKTKECSDLTNLIKKLQTTVEESSKKQSKHYQKNEEAYKEQISNMQQQIEMMEKQLVQCKKNSKRNERSLREQYDASIQDISKHYEELKTSLLKTIEELKQKSTEAREMTKKLQQNLSESEEKNTKLSNENSNLDAEKKTLNSQLMSLKQQIQKDKQQLQVQIAAQMMACETKIQKATQETKEASEKHLKELLNIVADSLGTFYNVDDEFNEEVFKQIVAHAKDDLERLQYFQKEATQL